MAELRNNLSVLTMRCDGLDQAKHKVPRCMVPTKSFQSVVRPSLHVAMCWTHSHALQFAVSDTDMRKDSATNFDVMARQLNQIYLHLDRSLPSSLYLVLDNTSRENKNSKTLRCFIKLVLLQVIEQVYLAFGMKGHTHSSIDAVGGQAVVSTSTHTFEDDMDLVEVYDNFLRQAKLETGTHLQQCYKHDESADWGKWIEDVPLTFKAMTGPLAPHLFRICRRKHLSRQDLEHATMTAAPTAQPGVREHPDDVMLALHSFMSDAAPFQLALLFPAQEAFHLQNHMVVQPVAKAALCILMWHCGIVPVP